MNRFTRIAAVISALMLTSCGGGASDGVGSVVVPPNGSSSTGGGNNSAQIFSAAGTGALVASIVFDANGNGVRDGNEALASADALGLAGASVSGLMPNSGTVPTRATTRLLAFGADTSTGFIVASLSAPAGATVVSPLTTIIDGVGDQAAVRRAFGLTGVIGDETDLLKFNAPQHLNGTDAALFREAARVTAINFRIIALAQLVSRYRGDPVDVGSGTGPEGTQYIAEVIRETGSADFSNAEVVRRVLQKGTIFMPQAPDQLQIAAEAFAKFMRTVPVQLLNYQEANKYHLAFRFFVLAKIRAAQYTYPSPALQELNALTEVDMATAATTFAYTPRPEVGGLVYALPDYLEVRGPTTLPPSAILRNDVAGYPYAVGGLNKTLLSVATDERTGSEIYVRILDGKISIEPLGSFTGYTHFDYVAQDAGGETRARAHVLVRRI